MSKAFSRLTLFLESLRISAFFLVWRATHLQSAGRALIRALEYEEPLRMLAGMLLVKSKQRAIPLLMEAIHRRYQLPITLVILGDIGDETTRHKIQEFIYDPDPQVVLAAREAMRILEAHRSTLPSHPPLEQDE